MTVYFTALLLSLSLIFAIGAQNAFVLRQGLRGEHLLAVCLTCALSDAILITAGIAGFGLIVEQVPWLIDAMRYGGALFLFVYGARSLWSAWRGGEALAPSAENARGLWPTVLTTIALTWLNPHVYLDTVMLLGSISTQYPDDRIVFGAGAITGAALFFFSLGFGARLLRPIFARPAAWRVLDLVIAIVMWAIAASLVLG
jgi:L-lysine exporter family protein LysE/ArgO